MTDLSNEPKAWAKRFSKLLDKFHAIHGGDRFPVDVKMLIQQTPETFNTGEPLVIEGRKLDLEFEGALFNLNAGEPTPASWAIIYNEAITSPGRMRFTLAHELGHYMLHRQLQEAFNCNEADMLHWDSPERQMEAQADLFASHLLMPIDDFRKQLSSTTVDLDVLGGCADHYGVSLTAATLKWLEFTDKRALLVMSREGVVQWARGSESGQWLSRAINKKLPGGRRQHLPAQCSTVMHTESNVDRQGTLIDARIWFPKEPNGTVLREMRIVSDQYRQTMTLLILPPEVKPWERDKSDCTQNAPEDTYDHFIRKG